MKRVPYPPTKPPAGWRSAQWPDEDPRHHWQRESWEAWENEVIALHKERVFTIDDLRALYNYAYNSGSERGVDGGSFGEWLQKSVEGKKP